MRPAITITPLGGGAVVSPWLPLDPYTASSGLGIFCHLVGGTAAYSVEMTPDDVFNPAVTPVAYPCGVASLTTQSADASGQIIIQPRAVRVNQASGTGQVQLTAVVSGLT